MESSTWAGKAHVLTGISFGSGCWGRTSSSSSSSELPPLEQIPRGHLLCQLKPWQSLQVTQDKPSCVLFIWGCPQFFPLPPDRAPCCKSIFLTLICFYLFPTVSQLQEDDNIPPQAFPGRQEQIGGVNFAAAPYPAVAGTWMLAWRAGWALLPPAPPALPTP